MNQTIMDVVIGYRMLIDDVRGIKTKVAAACPNKAHCAYKAVHDTGHGIYFVAAALEGHGLYSTISLVLLGVLIWGVTKGEEA